MSTDEGHRGLQMEGGLGTQGEHRESRHPEQMHVRLITCKGLHSGTAIMKEGVPLPIVLPQIGGPDS